MGEDVGLTGLELVLRRYEEQPERERCGQLRLVLARALAAERNRMRRDRLASMLVRVERLLSGPDQVGADSSFGNRES